MEKTIFLTLQIEELEEIIRKVIREELSNIARMPETKNTDDDELLKIDQVSEILKISAVTIHKWKKMGILPYYKLNRRLYFKKSDIINSLRNINLQYRRKHL